VLDFQLDAQAAVAAPRVHHQWLPEALMVEPDIVRDVREGLERRGQKLRELPRIGVANVMCTHRPRPGSGRRSRSAGAPAGY